jgi:hypothetical protein
MRINLWCGRCICQTSLSLESIIAGLAFRGSEHSMLLRSKACRGVRRFIVGTRPNLGIDFDMFLVIYKVLFVDATLNAPA